MSRPPRAYSLSPELLAAHGGPVLCLSAQAEGRTYRLHRRRPDAIALRVGARTEAGYEWRRGNAQISPEPEAAPALILVRVDGPLGQRAIHHEPCGGWSDGHDAVCERLVAAFELGDVLLVVDSPGGAAAGLQQAVERAAAAKARLGRRCTVFADEQIGSAAYWWAVGVGDEIFVPPAGQVGSIGARGGHTSIAGALEKDGLKVTYFAWPDDGKIAFAPERDLDEEGLRRGTRDVDLCGEAFAAAVVASAIGQRHGLTRDAIVALSADVLTGQSAVDAGLADGVASFDDTVSYALALTESGSAKGAQIMSEEERMESPPTSRSPGSEPPPSSAPPSSEPASGEKAKCAKCGAEGDDGDKHCAKCGARLRAEEPEKRDEDPPSSKPAESVPPSSAPPSSKPASSRPAAPAARASASFAEILGLSASASLPAQKAAAIDLARVFAAASNLTGHRTAPGILDGLKRIGAEAAQAKRLRDEAAEAKAKARKVERRDLCKRLIASGGEERGRVFVDRVARDGARVLRDGKPVVDLTPVYSEMRLSTLRQLVEDHERRAAPRSPFEPDPERAPGAAAGKGETDSQIKAAAKLPAVARIAEQTGAKLEDAAREWIRASGGAL